MIKSCLENVKAEKHDIERDLIYFRNNIFLFPYVPLEAL